MSEHLTESSIGGEVSAWCAKCKRHTAHRIDRVAVGHHAGKAGPCLEHASQWLTEDQVARRWRQEQQRREAAQGNLFGGKP